MKQRIFTGAGVALITPMHPDGSVNYEKLGEIIEDQIQNQTDALIICGTTGESPVLSDEEHRNAIAFAVEKTAKRIPVVAGTGSNDTSYAVTLSKEAQKLGADGLLMVTPYYNKTSQRGLVAHYEKVAANVDLPIILYSVPSRTGVNIEPETCLKLSKIDNIVAIKEASGNISQVAKIRQLCGDQMDIYSGNDDQIVPVLSLGGIGVISVLSNVLPRETHEMVQTYLDGDVQKSLQLQIELLELCNALFCDVNPIPVKAAMNMMGWQVGECRQPLLSMEPEKVAYLADVMRRTGRFGELRL